MTPSYVLQAIGLSREEAYNTIRVGLGRFTTQQEIHQAIRSMTTAYRHLQQMDHGQSG